MAISIHNAVNNVFSENYDKKNILFYLILSVISSMLYFGASVGKTTTMAVIGIVLLILSAILGFWITGIFVTASNNAIISEEGVFPSPVSNIKKLCINALKYYGGVLTTGLVITAIWIIPVAFLNALNSWALLLAIPYGIILLILFIGISINFLRTLKFSKWYDLKGALKLLSAKSGAPLLSFVVRGLVLYIITCVIFTIIALVLIVITNLSGGIAGISKTAVDLVNNLISSFLGSVLFGVLSVLCIDLTAQFVKETDSNNEEQQPQVGTTEQ